MLQLENITLRFADRTLLDGVDALVNPDERVGLVGPNGAGKSTLLKIIAGTQQPDEGKVVFGSGSTVGYLPQDGVAPDPTLTVLEEVRSAFPEIINLQEEIEGLQKQMENQDPNTESYQKVIEAFGEAQHRLESSRAYTLQSDIERILSGLGFTETDMLRSTTEFSGGWLMRIALAKLLLRTPTYLLLDEPTNHLDIESLSWIEQFLSTYEGTVVVVSHDRAFLDGITKRTLALSEGDLRSYAGNYSFYEKKEAEEEELLRKQYENQQKELKQADKFIERFRYKATKSKQVQSRIKQLDKLERIELKDRQDEISFRFPQPDRSGKVVMELKNISKSYGDNTIFKNIDYQIERGDKIAVVGPNGAGKSTLIRILAGTEPVTGGERVPGHNVTSTWFAQHQAEELNPANTILEEIREGAPGEGDTRLRTLLGCFLFTGDDVFKKVRVLSGGEKSRLALAKMLITPSNFIILDEPTNHLDMQSKKILQNALQQFEGTCMIVTHDRAFVDPIVNKTLEIQPGRLKTWLGDITWYLEKRKEEENLQNSAGGTKRTGAGNVSANGAGNGAGSGSKSRGSGRPSATAATSANKSDGLSKKERRRLEAEKRQSQNRNIKPLQKKISAVEKEIEIAEGRKEEIEGRMADPEFYEDSDRVKKVTLEYSSVKEKLTDLYSRWEEIARSVEQLQ